MTQGQRASTSAGCLWLCALLAIGATAGALLVMIPYARAERLRMQDLWWRDEGPQRCYYYGLDPTPLHCAARRTP